MRELRPGIWHWQAPHPAWDEEEWWPELVSSYAIELDDDVVLFDPLSVPDPLRERVVPLPADVDPVLGVLVAHMGPICANGLLHAAAEECGRDVRDLGDGVRGRCVLVVGGGVIGLLVGLFAAWLGAAEVAVADETDERLATAAALATVEGLAARIAAEFASDMCPSSRLSNTELSGVTESIQSRDGSSPPHNV